MKLKATKSIFGTIYALLAVVAIAVSVGCLALVEGFVVPRLVETRAESVLSLIRSHESDVVLNKTRSLRDALLRSNVISHDQQFSHYFSDEKERLESKECHFVNAFVCLGNKKSLFFIPNSLDPAREHFKFAVALESDLTQPPLILRLWEGVGALLLAVAFFVLYRGIAKKEAYLLSRLDTAASAFSEVKNFFSGAQGQDEFETFGRSAKDLTTMLKDYKAKFERKTRLEQLGLTVGQVSHDLKAPLNEAENFLQALPLLLETTTAPQIEEARLSLIKRIQNGKTALNHALQTTKQTNVARELVDLREFTQSLQTRIRENAKLKNLSLTSTTGTDYQILGDKHRLETAFLNLLENSADEKPDADVNINVSAAGGILSVLYKDNGRGIPQEYVNKIFDPLVTFKAGGTGLGLSSTKEILEQHGASISAVSCTTGAIFEMEFARAWGANA